MGLKKKINRKLRQTQEIKYLQSKTNSKKGTLYIKAAFVGVRIINCG